MVLINNIQIFLKKKLEKDNLKRKMFAQESGIPYTTVNKLINAQRLNPELTTILKIADFFNCSIDEVIGRENYHAISEKYKFKNVSLDTVNYVLKKFINDKLEKNNLNPYKLGRQIGFSESPIIEFISSPNKTLSSSVIVALADYFKISIDEMIGRVPPLNQKSE